MNNIQEKDWADDGWCGHTGMDSFSDFSIAGDKDDEVKKNIPEAVTEDTERSKQE
jgi:hypothetical protein